MNRYAECLVALIGVMGPAPQGQILDARGPTARKRNDVMELQTSGLGAPAAGPDERTSPFVPRPYVASHRGWDVARATGRC